MKVKIDIWHFIYFIIILGIVLFFSLCMVPGKINEDAYDNVSFAATVTSIVLAVVSILYTLLSGFSSESSLKEIKEVESRISIELDKFSHIESSIKNYFQEKLDPMTNDLNDIKNRQNDLQKAQSEGNKNIADSIQLLTKPVMPQGEPNNIEMDSSTEIYKTIATPYLLNVMLYTAIKSQKTKMDLPINNILKPLYSIGAYIGEGYLKCLSVYKPEAIELGIGSKPTRTKVLKYDETILGTEEWLLEQIKAYNNQDLVNNTIKWLDGYFSGSDQDNIG